MPAIDDLVSEESTSTGTGNLTLAASAGYRRFSAAFGTGVTTNVFYYFISNQDAAEWEVGSGHMSDANTLVRDTVLASSNSNNAVNFSAGTKYVSNDLPKAKQVNVDDLGDLATKDTVSLTADVTGDLPLSNLAQGTALSVLGVTGNSTADNASIAAGSDHQVLRRSGTSLGFGAINLAQAAAVTGILAAANGGTNNGFFQVSGPASSTKTMTFPNASATVLTDQAGEINAITAKTTPVDADLLLIEDSAASNAKKKSTIAQVLSGAIKQGVHEVWIDASAMRPRATNGPEAVDYDSGANDVTLRALAFDTSTQEYAHFKLRMPKSWNEGTVTFIPIWTNTGGASTQNVVWSLAGRAVGNDDAINGAFGTAQTSNDTWLAQNDLHAGPESSAITIGNTPAEGDLVAFEVSRVVGSDNMAGDALLLGVVLRLTINAVNDA
jgi:hypothetical protein